MRLGQSRNKRSSDETAFLDQFEREDCETIDPLAFGVYADLREDGGVKGCGYRRIYACGAAKALITAYRVVADELVGVSPIALARDFANRPGIFTAEGQAVCFVCGKGAKAAIKAHDLVQKYDDFPALYAPLLPDTYRTRPVVQALQCSAFNVAKLRGKPLFVFNDLAILAGVLEKLPLGAGAAL